MNIDPGNNQPFHDGAPDVPAVRPSGTPQQARPSDPLAGGSFPPEQLDLAETDRRRHAHRRARRGEHRMRARVRHPDGGEHPVGEILREEHEQRKEIESERKKGSRKHHRLPRWLHHVPKMVALFDFGLLLYFFAGITNVDWTRPLSVSLVFAVMVAAMLTVLAYGFFSFTGHRLRSYKDHSGAVPMDGLDGLTKAAIAGSIIGIAVLATLMFIRMRTEVLYALGTGAGGTAFMVALTLAVVNALANFLVIIIHALDGSDQTARLDKLSAAIRRHTAAAHRNWEDTTVLEARSVTPAEPASTWGMTYYRPPDYRPADPAWDRRMPSLGTTPERTQNGESRP